ncbi:hypothetical protein [Bradyrhizobium sp. CCBAU 53338]|uniref:hypothetical protein n=1 Tax=Bradyrhizobium sp. CCBAU 53338 TaxID=1325111 RepID=UPI001889F8D4|nr:hypothetical protein [Bradyrhizobium sp. CCBAU 53338]QOZ52950.1 hypothetical protein XH90_17440 [Bradyrhizobium sp. CCBAU 53338]
MQAIAELRPEPSGDISPDAEASLNDLSNAFECARTIFNYATMLGVLLASPDAENAVSGMHQLMHEVRDLAMTVQNLLNRASGGRLDPTSREG